MKRKYIVLLAVLICIGGTLSVLFVLHKLEESNLPKVESFCLKKYQWEIKTFSTDNNYGEVNDRNIAIKIAKLLWLEKYQNDVPKKRINVAYDSNEECWHVYNKVSQNTLGGVLHAIIQKNGDVLAVWCED